MHTILNLAEHLEYWDATMKIYVDSFPEWEREANKTILKRLKTKEYEAFIYTIDSEVLAFAILDVNEALQYALFSFLAVLQSKRGLGIGSKLCLYVMDYFKTHLRAQWLFIEAEERQALLYERLGFEKLALDYRVPKFNSLESVPMTLMIITKKALSTDILLEIIKDIFHRGYSLDADDIRIQQQLRRIV